MAGRTCLAWGRPRRPRRTRLALLGLDRRREPGAFPLVQRRHLAAAKAAIAGLDHPLAGTDLLATPATLAELRTYAVPATSQIALIGWLDGLVLLRRDLDGVTDAADRDHPCARRPARRPVAPLTDCHIRIVDRGRLIGLCDYDPGTEEVVWAPITKLTAGPDHIDPRRGPCHRGLHPR